jgi:hypothetical protein
MIKQKIGHINGPTSSRSRIDYIVSKPQRDKNRKTIYSVAHHFFENLKLMTPVERLVLAKTVINTCPAGPPKNVHLVLDYLSRLTSLPPQELTSLFSRLDCLSLQTRVKKSKEHCGKEKLAKPAKILELKYEPSLIDFDGNATDIMVAIFHCIFDNLCPNCAGRAVEIVDLSILSTLAGFAEEKVKDRSTALSKPAGVPLRQNHKNKEKRHIS